MSRETIHNLHYNTKISPSDLYLPKKFFAWDRYDLVLNENPYKGTLGNPHWDVIAVQILAKSKGGQQSWIGVEGFRYLCQTETLVEGMIDAGWLKKLSRAGYALTEATIKKLLIRSRKIQKSVN